MLKKIFEYDERFFGGAEYFLSNVTERIISELPKFNNYNCMAIPGHLYVDSLLDQNKKNIIWLGNHLNQYDENVIKAITNPKVIQNTKFFIALSETHKKALIDIFNIPKEKIYVLPLFFENIQYNDKKNKNNSPIEIIHLSNSGRGIEVLLNSLPLIKDDFILRIFNDYYPDLEKNKDTIELIKDPRIIFYGKTPRKTLYRYIEKAHIHAYPGIYDETFCLAQVESMAAGCLCVYGVLPYSSLDEVSGNFGLKYKVVNNFSDNVSNFSNKLQEAIKIIKEQNFNPVEQINFVEKNFSFNACKEKWASFHEIL